MPRFSVDIIRRVTYCIDIEAASAEEAIATARDADGEDIEFIDSEDIELRVNDENGGLVKQWIGE